MFMTAFAGFWLGATLYRFDMCVTSRILRAEPWFADTVLGRGPSCESGSGECAGFSMTVPNCVKDDWVSSSIGTRIDGAGALVGILAVAGVQLHRPW